jgi:hypothetical protein
MNILEILKTDKMSGRSIRVHCHKQVMVALHLVRKRKASTSESLNYRSMGEG